MLLQEFRKTATDPLEFIVDDAVQFVANQLTAAQRSRLGRNGIQSIIEWQVHGLQQSVKGVRRGDGAVVMGATDDLIAYVESNAGPFQPGDVEAVLTAQAGYLESIGAVAAPVVEDGGDGLASELE